MYKPPFEDLSSYSIQNSENILRLKYDYFGRYRGVTHCKNLSKSKTKVRDLVGRTQRLKRVIKTSDWHAQSEIQTISFILSKIIVIKRLSIQHHSTKHTSHTHSLSHNFQWEYQLTSHIFHDSLIQSSTPTMHMLVCYTTSLSILHLQHIIQLLLMNKIKSYLALLYTSLLLAELQAIWLYNTNINVFTCVDKFSLSAS